MLLPFTEHRLKSSKLDADTIAVFVPHDLAQNQADFFLTEDALQVVALDAGMGLIPFKPCHESLLSDPSNEVICRKFHSHTGHFGAIGEIDIHHIHPA